MAGLYLKYDRPSIINEASCRPNGAYLGRRGTRQSDPMAVEALHGRGLQGVLQLPVDADEAGRASGNGFLVYGDEADRGMGEGRKAANACGISTGRGTRHGGAASVDTELQQMQGCRFHLGMGKNGGMRMSGFISFGDIIQKATQTEPEGELEWWESLLAALKNGQIEDAIQAVEGAVKIKRREAVRPHRLVYRYSHWRILFRPWKGR
jgi:hypothetical protein